MEKWKRLESIRLIESSVITHTGLHFSTYVRELLETLALGRWKENPPSIKVENDSTNTDEIPSSAVRRMDSQVGSLTARHFHRVL